MLTRYSFVLLPLVALGCGRDQSQPNAEKCAALWRQAVTDNSGALTAPDAGQYVSHFALIDTNSDGRISKSEFISGCAVGMVKHVAPT